MHEQRVPADEIEWGPPGEDDEGGRRRRLLAVALALPATTGGLLTLTGGAMAHTTFTANDVAGTSNGGDLTSLTVSPTGDVHYTGLEGAPSSVDVEVKPSAASSRETPDSKSLSASGPAGTANYSFSTNGRQANTGGG